MKRSTVSAIVSLAMLGAGCGPGAPESASTASTAKTSETATASPSPTATIEQYASIVSGESDLKSRMTQLESCDWLGSGSIDANDPVLTCRVGVTTLGLQGTTLATKLRSAGKPGAGNFIGAPPAEIETLVAGTIEQGKGLYALTGKFGRSDCAETGSGACVGVRFDMFSAIRDFDDQIAAWEPYQ